MEQTVFLEVYSKS